MVGDMGIAGTTVILCLLGFDILSKWVNRLFA